MDISFLPDPEAHPLWPEIRELLRPAADDGPVLTDNELVWIAIEDGVIYAAATTILWNDGDAQLRLAGGCRHREWAGPLSEMVSDWARDCGARKLTGRGRKGWQRYARRFGWAPLGTDEDGMTLYEKGLG